MVAQRVLSSKFRAFQVAQTCHYGYGFVMGREFETLTRTRHTHTRQPSGFAVPVSITKYRSTQARPTQPIVAEGALTQSGGCLVERLQRDKADPLCLSMFGYRPGQFAINDVRQYGILKNPALAHVILVILLVMDRGFPRKRHYGKF